jgi:hypothetical protein
MSEKILWNSVIIKVPSEFISVNARGQIKIAPPLTKKNNISKRNKKPSINIVTDDNINKIQIQNEGEYKTKNEQPKKDTNKTDMHEKMARLRAMRKSNKKELDKMAAEDINRVGSAKERIKERQIRRKNREPETVWKDEDEELYRKVMGESSKVKTSKYNRL